MISLEALNGRVYQIDSNIETWRFSVSCHDADLVYLVTATDDGSTNWTPMRRELDGSWQTELDLRQGEYRFRYFIARGASMMTAGADGLTADRAHTSIPTAAMA